MVLTSYLVGATILLSVISWYLTTQFTRKARLINKFPGPLIFPFIGGLYCAIWASGHRIQSYVEKQFEKYCSNTISVWIGHKPRLITKDLHLIEKILSTTTHVEKGNPFSEGAFFMGEKTIIMSPAHVWKPSRRAVLPAFSKAMMEKYVETFNHHTNTMISILDETISQKKDQYLNLHPIFLRCACDILSDSIWDEKFDFQRKPELRLYEAISGASALAGSRELEPWIKIPFLYKLLGYQKLEDQIVQQLHKIFPDEGLETTSTGLAITLFMLGNHKNVQEKVYEEIQSQLGSDWTKELSTEDLKRLTYMDLVIKESLRICMPIPTIFRVTGADIVLSNGLIVPKGTEVFLNLQSVHSDPALYPNPKDFIPERYLDEKLATKNPYSYLLFSKGPRNCIGRQFGSLQLKVMLTKILMKFKVDSANRLEDQHFHYNFVIEPVGGLKINLSHR